MGVTIAVVGVVTILTVKEGLVEYLVEIMYLLDDSKDLSLEIRTCLNKII